MSSYTRKSPREKAIAAGKKIYFTGRMCKNGHTVARRVTDHTCIECKREMIRKRRRAKKSSDFLCEVSKNPHQQWANTQRAAYRQRLRAFEGCKTHNSILEFEKSERSMARLIERELIKNFIKL